MFQFFISFLANSNIWVALCAIASIEQTLIIYNVDINSNMRFLEVFVFCATYIVYNLHRFVALPQVHVEQKSQRHFFVQQNKKYVIAAMSLASILALIALFNLHFEQGLALIVLGFIAIFYTFPFPIGNFNLRLRDYGLIKPFIIGFAWASVCVLLPLMENIISDYITITLLWFNRFLFATAITIPFDVRDIQFDKQNIKHATIPIKYGKLRTYWYAQALLIISVIPLFIIFLLEQNIEEYLIPTILWYLITSNIIRKNLLSEAKEMHYSFWLDGTLVFGFILYWIFYTISH